ncbi:MAG TPA: type II toxin-antitoxin system RelE/ParE family toxin [Balneolales bacterium]|nr:type II toxin-antitoxin system RelE/ParE family toxin [Balneolales bacterium]
MTKTFIITPQAQKDFESGYGWYEEQYRGLGREFARCVDTKIAELRRNPEHFQIIYKSQVRRALVFRFPYAVYFVDKPDVLSIFAIQRQSRNPELWQSRI